MPLIEPCGDQYPNAISDKALSHGRPRCRVCEVRFKLNLSLDRRLIRYCSDLH